MKNEKGSCIREKYLKGIALVIVFLILSGFFPGMGASFAQRVEAAENTNVTQEKPATASSYMLPYSPERAVDGNYSHTSRWVVASNSVVSGNWIMVDLGGYYTCNRWTVQGIEDNWSGLVSNGYEYSLGDYTLQRSLYYNDWSDVNSGSGTLDRNISRFTARYVRLLIGNGNLMNNNWAAVQEFAVYGYATVVPTITNAIPPMYAADGSKVTIQSVIADDGGDNVTEKGIVYSTSENPDIEDTSDTKISSDAITSDYAIDLTGLDPHTTYYVRAYAKNIMGTGYGKSIKLNISKAVDVALTGSTASAVYGQAVTYTATLSVPLPTENTNTPTGDVDFKDGDTLLGTVAISGNVAEFTFSSLASGSHNITAVYKGDTNCDSNYSAIWAQTVDKANTSTVVTSSANPSVYKQGVTYSATVSAVAPGTGTPTGSITFRDAGSLLGTVPLTGGIASYMISEPAVGSHNITAYYNEDSNYMGSAQASLTQVVNKANTVTALSAAPNPSVYGQSVTYTAAVSAAAPGSGTPTGTVTFKDGAASLGTVALSGGTAVFSTSTLAAGSHSMTVEYNGDGSYNISASSALTQTINKSDTAVVLSSSLNPSDLGQAVSITATVGAIAPGSGTPTGTVTFYDGGVALGAPVTLAGDTATYTTSLLAAGNHSISVVYSGDGNYNGITSSALTQNVNKLNTATTLIGAPNPSTYGQVVTYTAAVTAGATGTVTLKDGATTLGTATLSGDGTAAFATSVLIGGSHSITAVYEGDSSYNSSISTTLTQVVNTATSITMLSSSPNPSTYGQSTTYTSTVTAGATGTVTFMDGAAPLGTATLSGGGTASFSTAALAGGSHSISAVYSGDINYGGSTSSTITHTVNAANPTILLSGGPNPSIYGQAVTLTATLPSGASGTVTFQDGAATLGTATPNGEGIATFIISSLETAEHSITAVYGGDINYSPVISSALTQVVNATASTTALACTSNPSIYGQSVTYTATVTAGATGTVTFKDGSATLGTGTLSGSTATFSTSTLSGGSHSITAVYGGDSNYAASTSSALTQVVSAAASEITLEGSLNPSDYGQQVTYTATVTAGATGTVTFKDGSATLGTGVLSGTTATFTTSALSGGSHSITAVYEGDANYGASTSSVFVQVVNAAVSTTSIECSPNPSTYGQTVTMTATVPSTATGTVTFKDGSTTLGMAAAAGGTATFTTAALPAGTHSITAIYGGDANFAGSTSSAMTQVVNAAASTTSIVCSPNPSTLGQSVTLTATVTSGATGTVTFMDGSTTLGTASMAGGTAILTTSTLSVGTHSITAVYGGDANYSGSTSSESTQVVNPVNTTTTLSSSPNPSVFGQAVTLTATVTSGATGTVTFMDGSAMLGITTLSGGSATFTTAALPGGSRSMTAIYSGDTNYSSSTSSELILVVDQTATTTTLAGSPNPSSYGQTVTYTATVTAGATGTVTFMDGIDTLGTATLSGGTATFTTSALSGGSHNITAVYGGDGNYAVSIGALIQVVSSAASATTLSSSPNPSAYGQSVTLTASLPSGATGTVSFKDGAATLGTETLSGSGTATLAISVLSLGTHALEAVYSGDANFAASSSGAYTHIVAASAVAITVTSSPAVSIKGQEVTFTAEVSAEAPGNGTPTGTVTFKDGGTPLLTAALSGGIATYKTASLEVATHNITAEYSGDGNFNSCTSAPHPYIVGENAVGKAEADILALTIGFATGDNENSVTQDLNLPDEGAIYDSLVKWSSSATSVISNTGEVTRPSFGSGNANVTVTAAVYNEDVVDTKDFPLIVLELTKAEPTSTEKVAADKASLAITYTTGEDEESVKSNISLPQVGLAYGSAITWESSDPSFIDIEVSNGEVIGEVTRPFFASGNADVTVTAYVYNNGASDERDFQLTVLKLPRSDDGGDKPRDRGNNNKPDITVTTTTVNTSPETEVTVTTATTVSEARIDKAGNASATITPVQVSEAIDRAIEEAALQEGGAAAVAEIRIIAPGDVKSVEAIIPGNAINTAADSNISALTVSTPIASVTFDQESLGTISQETEGNVNINISKIDTETLPEEVQDEVGDRPVFDFSVTSGGKAITQFGGSVAVSIPYTPKAGEDTNAIVIYYINGDGKLETISDCVYDKASGTIHFNTSHFSRYAIGYNKVDFTDVAEDAWYEAAVTFTSARGISNGTGDGKYGPQERLTRGQFIVMAMRAFGISPDENPSSNFADAGNTYYTGYLAAAKRLGLTKGTGEGRYSPDKEISRQEMFALLYSVLDSTGKLPENGDEKKLSAYADEDQIAVWAKDAMSLFVGTGTIKGSNGRLNPEAMTSRAEMAQVLLNLISEY